MKALFYFLGMLCVLAEINMLIRVVVGLEQLNNIFVATAIFIFFLAYFFLIRAFRLNRLSSPTIKANNQSKPSANDVIKRTESNYGNSKIDYLLKLGLEKEIIDEDGIELYKLVLEDDRTDEHFREVINQFLIPFKISPLKYSINKRAYEMRFTMLVDEPSIAPSLVNLFKKSNLSIKGFPDFFYIAFPDVILWTIFDGKEETSNLFKSSEMSGFYEDRQVQFDILTKLIKLYLSRKNKLLECRQIKDELPDQTGDEVLDSNEKHAYLSNSYEGLIAATNNVDFLSKKINKSDAIKILNSRKLISEPGKYQLKVTNAVPFHHENNDLLIQINSFAAMTSYQLNEAKRIFKEGSIAEEAGNNQEAEILFQRTINYQISCASRIGKDYCPIKGEIVNVVVDYVKKANGGETLMAINVSEIKPGSAPTVNLSKTNYLTSVSNEVTETLVIESYRKLAKKNNFAPTEKTTDAEIIKIYKDVYKAFRDAACAKKEIIPVFYLNTIVLKFLQIYEQFGKTLFDQHLEYEVEKYSNEGLRDDYKKELTLYK